MKKTLKINLEVLKVLSSNEVGVVQGGGSSLAATGSRVGNGNSDL